MTTATITPTTARQARWSEEARFFDEWADRVEPEKLPIDPLAWKRYTSPRLRSRFNKEFRMKVLGNLAGKRLLDVGCGDGLNVALFAKMGAQVTGIDVSRGAVELGRRRAEANGVGGRVELVCSPIETADIPPQSFDVIWGDGILHHVLDELEGVIRQLVRWIKPGGLFVFNEPLNFNQPLRRFRQMIPVVTEATPGERPLVPAEVALIRRYIPDLHIRHFNLLGRLDAFILTSFNYERSSFVRRAAVNLTTGIDRALLSLPGLRNLGGAGVLYGRARP